MPYPQYPSDEEQSRRAFGSESDLARANEELKKFHDNVRVCRRDCARTGFYAMEFFAHEAQQLLQRARELESDWSEPVKQTLTDSLRQAEAEAERTAVWLIEFGLKDFLKQTKDRVAHLKRHPDQLSVWDARAILDGSDVLDQAWDDEFKAKCANQLRATRKEALAIADELENTAHLNNIEVSRQRRISSILIIQRIREQMEMAIEFFNRKGKLTPYLQQRIREAQERAARFRSEKKLAEAQIAEAAGRSQPSERLKREAAAMLIQDWASFFPGETPPSIV